ncbi:MAG: glycerophosphodiester phosphodiesterase [Sphingomonas sp.]|jgi:glycerophosphoryl diester phosphodiesterase
MKPGRFWSRSIVFGLGSLFALAPVAAIGQDAPVVKSLSRPIVIGHRGASGHRPEHTLASYEQAIRYGADFVEPDLVLTKDNVFVARHENDITGTTDVADHPEFAARKTTRVIDGETHIGWFTEDFTLAELKTLRARERLPKLRPRNTRFDGQFEIPTLAEIIALVKQRTKDIHRTIGIYPETKHPSYFASIGLPMERKLADELRAAGWDSAAAPVFIQSFEVNNLKLLHSLTGIRLIQLMDSTGAPADHAKPSYAAMATPDGLREVATYAWGIGPDKAMIQKGDDLPGPLVVDAHRAGLRVHPWTFRAENMFLPPSMRVGTDPAAHGHLDLEIRRFIDLGVDGFFTDFPGIGFQTRKVMRR